MTDTRLINTNLNLFISIYQKSDRKKSRLDYKYKHELFETKV